MPITLQYGPNPGVVGMAAFNGGQAKARNDASRRYMPLVEQQIADRNAKLRDQQKFQEHLDALGIHADEYKQLLAQRGQQQLALQDVKGKQAMAQGQARRNQGPQSVPAPITSIPGQANEQPRFRIPMSYKPPWNAGTSIDPGFGGAVSMPWQTDGQRNVLPSAGAGGGGMRGMSAMSVPPERVGEYAPRTTGVPSQQDMEDRHRNFLAQQSQQQQPQQQQPQQRANAAKAAANAAVVDKWNRIDARDARLAPFQTAAGQAARTEPNVQPLAPNTITPAQAEHYRAVGMNMAQNANFQIAPMANQGQPQAATAPVGPTVQDQQAANQNLQNMGMVYVPGAGWMPHDSYATLYHGKGALPAGPNGQAPQVNVSPQTTYQGYQQFATESDKFIKPWDPSKHQGGVTPSTARIQHLDPSRIAPQYQYQPRQG